MVYLETMSAFGAIVKIFCCFISAVRTAFPVPLVCPLAGLDQCQILLADVYGLSPPQSLSFFRIQFIYRITAGHLNIVMTVPFYDGNEKDAEIAVGHKYLISAVAAA